ncbi:MAG: protein BatD [Chitinophagales bacterium]|nr:protein BatD [Chitinophagales bacterium]
MIHKRNIFRVIVACLMVAACAKSVPAQDAVFSASASANKIGIQDQVQVQYMIKDVPNLKTLGPKPEISKDFAIVGGPYQSSGTQMSYVNGHMTRSESITITYVLQPKRKGKMTIPAAVATDGNGDTYESNSLPLEVVDGTLAQQRQQRAYDPFNDDPFEALMQQRQRQMQAMQQRQQQQQATPEEANVNLDKDLFIKVEVDKSKVHVGEQITASYKLYAALPMNVSISKLPSLNGFWTQDFDMPKGKITPVEKVVDGKRYQVFTLKKSALFPQQSGTLELDPAEAEGVARIVQKTRQRDPFFDDPFFSSFFMDDPMADQFFSRMAYKDVRVTLKSKPVKIEVLPVPEEGKPESYTGAVGDFTVNSSIDKTEITTDDVANLKLVITGSGNIKLIEAPRLQLPNGLSGYDPAIVDTITGRTTTISGSKTITYAISARTPGDYTIPSIPFTYFNPETGKYVTSNTAPVKIQVKPGKNYMADAPSNTLLTDIHPIHTSPIGNLKLNSKPIVLSVGYWSIYAVPLFAFIGIIAWKRREDELAKDTTLLRNRRANKVALKRLAAAQKLLQKNERTPFYEEISKAIWLYLSDKLNIPLSSLSKENVWDALHNRNIDRALQQQTEQVMNECETALYSGTGGSQQMNQTYNEAVAVISKLEESFKA